MLCSIARDAIYGLKLKYWQRVRKDPGWKMCIRDSYLGERVMRPQFGSRTMDYVFESDSQDFALSVTGEITDALIRWEPRIEEVEVSAKMEGGDKTSAVIRISYRVRNTNNHFNLVYPFYMLEGIEA